MLDTQNSLQNHIKNTEATKFLLQSAFYTSKVLPFFEETFGLSFIISSVALPDRRLVMHIESSKSETVTLNDHMITYYLTTTKSKENQTNNYSTTKMALLKQHYE